MKRNVSTLALCVVVILMFCLSCCDPGTYYFDANEITKKASKIELVECKNDNPTLVKVESDTILYFNPEDVVVVKELEKDKIESFSKDLSGIRFHVENESVNSPVGYAVLIYMENKEIIVLSCTLINDTAYGMAALFTLEGDYIKHIARFADRPSYEKLLNKYFGVWQPPICTNLPNTNGSTIRNRMHCESRGRQSRHKKKEHCLW